MIINFIRISDNRENNTRNTKIKTYPRPQVLSIESEIFQITRENYIIYLKIYIFLRISDPS